MYWIERRREIEWGQCDPAGIVFSPRYLEMLDAATATLFTAALGEPKPAFVARHGIIGIPLARTETTYHAPCRYGDTVVIRSTVERIGRASIGVLHHVTRAGTLAVESRETRVWAAARSADATDIGGVPLPPDVAARLGAEPPEQPREEA